MRLVAALSTVLLSSGCGGRVEGAACDPRIDDCVCTSDCDAADAQVDVATDTPDAEDASFDAYAPQDAGPQDATTDAAAPDADAAPCPSGTHFDGGCVPDDPNGDLGAATPCLGGGNVFHVEADPDAYISTGVVDVPGHWAVNAQTYSNPNDVVLIEVMPNGDSVGMWSAGFMTDGFGASLESGMLYYPTESNYATHIPPGTMGLFHLQNDTWSCVDRSAAFVFDEYTPIGDGGGLASLTARFWVHCDGHSGLVRGCIHFHN